MLVSAGCGIPHPQMAVLVQRIGQKRGGCTGCMLGYEGWPGEFRALSRRVPEKKFGPSRRRNDRLSNETDRLRYVEHTSAGTGWIGCDVNYEVDASRQVS